MAIRFFFSTHGHARCIFFWSTKGIIWWNRLEWNWRWCVLEYFTGSNSPKWTLETKPPKYLIQTYVVVCFPYVQNGCKDSPIPKPTCWFIVLSHFFKAWYLPTWLEFCLPLKKLLVYARNTRHLSWVGMSWVKSFWFVSFLASMRLEEDHYGLG